MDIGTEGTPYVIEPLEDPVPGRERTPVADPTPLYPPVREPEPVPA